MTDARSFWKKHVVGWRASGETAKRYSARHGLSANSLGWWTSRLKRDGELKLRLVRGRGYDGYVIGGGMASHEDEKEWDAPSYWHDMERIRSGRT